MFDNKFLRNTLKVTLAHLPETITDILLNEFIFFLRQCREGAISLFGGLLGQTSGL